MTDKPDRPEPPNGCDFIIGIIVGSLLCLCLAAYAVVQLLQVAR